MILNKGDQVRNACQAAAEAFRKLDKPEYSDIIARLDFCIGSYDFDQNPVGLFEHAKIAHQMLSDLKKTSPRKISKKLLDDLEKSLAG
jgi:uncharacterized protein YutD